MTSSRDWSAQKRCNFGVVDGQALSLGGEPPVDVLVDLRGVVGVKAFADVTHGVPQDVPANDRLVFLFPSVVLLLLFIIYYH